MIATGYELLLSMAEQRFERTKKTMVMKMEKMNKNQFKMKGMRNAFSTRHFPLIPDSVKL